MHADPFELAIKSVYEDDYARKLHLLDNASIINMDASIAAQFSNYNECVFEFTALTLHINETIKSKDDLIDKVIEKYSEIETLVI